MTKVDLTNQQNIKLLSRDIIFLHPLIIISSSSIIISMEDMIKFLQQFFYIASKNITSILTSPNYFVYYLESFLLRL